MHDTNILENQPIAWTPSPEVVERAQLTKFMRQVGVSTWDELYQFSIRDVEKFTEEVVKFLDIRFDPPYDKLLDTSDGIEFPKWFTRNEGRSEDTPVLMSPSSGETDQAAQSSGLEDKSVLAPSHAGLNISTMCLDRWQTEEMKDQPAVIWEGENGAHWHWTYEELLEQVEYCACGLRYNGIGKGDAVAIHLPMTQDIVTVLMAIGRVGAIAVPIFSGYGVEAIASRLDAVGATALFTCNGFERRGKFVDAFSVAAGAVSKCSTIKKVIVRYLGGPEPELIDDRFENWHEFMNLKTELDGDLSWYELGYLEPTSAEDPLIILYTSGTTGKPKGIAHTHAGFPIKAAQDMAFGTDVGRGTRISWYTDIGWMMGPWLIYGALINGATICIYDGAPDYPTPDRIWEFCAKHKVEVLGISPTLVRSLASREQRSEDTLVLMSPSSSETDRAAQQRSEDTLVLMSPSSSETDRAAQQRSEDTLVLMSPSSGETDQAAQSSDLEDKSVLAPPQASERKGWSRHGKLPHFDGNATQFITFRLADSLPQGVLQRLKAELEREKPDDESEEYRRRVEQYLDLGAGECLLKNPDVAEILKTTILNEDNRSCDLKAWVVMPNHGHLLLRMRDGHNLGGLMKRIKGISARKINQLLGRTGSIWQEDYFDRYIRDAEHYSNAFRYIENNPIVARLVAKPEDWKYGSAVRRRASEDTPVLMSPSSGETSQAAQQRSEDTPVLMSPSSGEPDQAAQSSGLEDKSVLAPPFERHDLSSLRIFASTGEPWNPAPWWWLFEKVGNSKLPIINYSGGTEIAGGILMGNPLLPIKPCSFPAPCPGMDVDILDENGEPVRAGEVGELVIKQPWIGMARGFWQEKERYLETYWRRFKNIWVHGDWAMRDEDGHWFILGRSDDTLKVAGKRVGPAEVESLLVAHPLVTEAAVIGVPDERKGTAMVAFCVLKGAQASLPATPQRGVPGDPNDSSASTEADAGRMPALQSELRALVARDMGKPLAPSKIHFVSALPKTRNAKVMRRVLRAAYLGEDAGDLSALENPQTLDEIRRAR